MAEPLPPPDPSAGVVAPTTAPDGYGRVSKFLHWLTVVALTGQFTIGYVMEGDDSGRGRGVVVATDPAGGRGRGGDFDLFGEDWLLTVHVLLGATILVLATVRLLWRRHRTLPPWASGLSALERTLAHWTERALYLLLFVIPLSGLSLVLVTDDALVVHIGAHIAFFVVLAGHVGLVLKHQLIDRDRLLRRMI